MLGMFGIAWGKGETSVKSEDVRWAAEEKKVEDQL